MSGLPGPSNMLPPLALGGANQLPNPTSMPSLMHATTTQMQIQNQTSNADPLRQHVNVPGQAPPSRPPPPPLDTMRAYRACLNCRNRKSKCDLDINGGRPVSDPWSL